MKDRRRSSPRQKLICFPGFSMRPSALYDLLDFVSFIASSSASVAGFRCFRKSGSKPQDAVYRTAEQRIRQQGQDRGDNQGLIREDSVKDDCFIDQVDDYRRDKDLRYFSPAFPQQRVPANRVRDERPTVGGTALPCAFCSGTDRRNGGCYRLEDEPKRQRSVLASDEIFPHSSEIFFHIRTIAPFGDSARNKKGATRFKRPGSRFHLALP